MATEQDIAEAARQKQLAELARDRAVAEQAAATARKAAAEADKAVAEADKAAAEAEKSAAETREATRAAERKAGQDAANQALADEKARVDAAKALVESQQLLDDAKRTAARAAEAGALAAAETEATKKKAIADARKGVLSTWFPAPTVTALDGSITGSLGNTVGQAAAASSIVDAATPIAEAVAAAKPSAVLIVGGSDLAASDWAHAEVVAQTKALSEAARAVASQLEAVVAPQPTTKGLAGAALAEIAGGAAAVVPSLIGSAAQAASYFRSNYDLAALELDAPARVLTTAVAAELQAKNVVVRIDGMALLASAPGTTLSSFDDLLAARWRLMSLRTRASGGTKVAAGVLAETAKTKVTDAAEALAAVDAGNADLLAARRADLHTAEVAAAAAVATTGHLDGLIAAADKVEALIEAFVEKVTTVAASDTMPPLAHAALRDLLHEPGSNLHVLALDIGHVSAEAITKRSFFTRVRACYVGSAEVSAVLVAPTGTVAAAAAQVRTTATKLTLSNGSVSPSLDRNVHSSVTPPSPPEGEGTPGASQPAATAGQSAPPPPPPGPPGPPAPEAGADAPPTQPDGSTPAPAGDRQGDGGDADWTLMVFMAGMNNLAQFADRDIAELEVGLGQGGRVRATVFVKQQTGVRRMIVGGPAEAMAPDTDSGDATTVADFVRWSVAQAPAERYALVLWNHGTGWAPWAQDLGLPELVARSSAIDDARVVNPSIFPASVAALAAGESKVERASRARAILTDDATLHAVDTKELRSLLEDVNATLKGRLDVLAMDACLMSNLEVLHEVHDLVDVVVGSEELEPGDGWNYTTFAGDLAAKVATGGATAEDFGEIAVTAYLKSYETSQEVVTQSALDADRAAAFTATVAGLADALIGRFGEDPAGRQLLTDAVRRSKRFAGDLVDLGHLCRELERIAGTGPVASAAAAVVAGLAPGSDRFVICEGNHGDAVQGVSGVSIYLPVWERSAVYKDLRFAIDSRWDEMLAAFHGAG